MTMTTTTNNHLADVIVAGRWSVRVWRTGYPKAKASGPCPFSFCPTMLVGWS